MRRRIVTGACLMLLMMLPVGATAYAQDEPTGDPACEEQLTRAEELVHDKIEAQALSEADEEKVNMLLDEADALCTEGNIAEATATLATVTKMVSAPNQ